MKVTIEMELTRQDGKGLTPQIREHLLEATEAALENLAIDEYTTAKDEQIEFEASLLLLRGNP